MKAAAIGLMTIFVVAAASFVTVQGRGESDALLMPGFPVAKDVPNAMELPDPKMDYKVVFSVNRDPDDPGDVNPMLESMATYVNTLGKYGVPAEHRHIIAIIHHRTPGFDIVMTNEAYKKRYGRDNPNIEIIHALKKAGVDIRLCGQGLIGRKIDASEVNPDIQIDLWAMTSFVNLALQGYARIG